MLMIKTKSIVYRESVLKCTPKGTTVYHNFNRSSAFFARAYILHEFHSMREQCAIKPQLFAHQLTRTMGLSHSLNFELRQIELPNTTFLLGCSSPPPSYISRLLLYYPFRPSVALRVTIVAQS